MAMSTHHIAADPPELTRSGHLTVGFACEEYGCLRGRLTGSPQIVTNLLAELEQMHRASLAEPTPAEQADADLQAELAEDAAREHAAERAAD
jgi:hypothetical protein